jgi:hypothetical protein
MKMDEAISTATTSVAVGVEDAADVEASNNEIRALQADFRSRLVIANLRTEAVRAGMVDLDGLKLINLSEAQLDPDDGVVGGRQIMDDLKRRKPWLFGGKSSSSVSAAPASQPVRHKTALEMTDEEYAAARAALTKRRYI